MPKRTRAASNVDATVGSAALIAIVLGACHSQAASGAAMREPQVHRAAAAACSAPRAAGSAMPITPQDQCEKDSDCTQGPNGRCNPESIGSPGNAFRLNACTYDKCTTDADCGEGAVCDCRNATNFDANVCFARGNCQIDADCGPDGWCSPSATLVDTCTGGIPGPMPVPAAGYFCHTAADECVDDMDCPSTSGGTPGHCYFDPNKAHWACFGYACFG